MGIHDELVLDAIRTHTYCGTSPYFDDPLTWCLRFADLLESTRNWRDKTLRNFSPRLRDSAYAGQIKQGAFFNSGLFIKMFEANGMPVHPTIRRVHQELGLELGLDSSLLELDS